MRAVPLLQGQFDLHDYIEYLQSFFKSLGPPHVIARVPAVRSRVGRNGVAGARGFAVPTEVVDADGSDPWMLRTIPRR